MILIAACANSTRARTLFDTQRINFHREFTDDPALTTAAQALPQMQGSGLVRDLRPAMSLGTAQSLDLQAKLTQFAAGTTHDQQMAHLDALVQSWGKTSSGKRTLGLNREMYRCYRLNSWLRNFYKGYMHKSPCNSWQTENASFNRNKTLEPEYKLIKKRPIVKVLIVIRLAAVARGIQ